MRTHRFEQLEPRTLMALIAWDGGGDGFTLTDAANWAGDTLPGAGDDAEIDIGSNPLIVHSAGSFTVNSITSAESLTVSGGTITVAAASSFTNVFNMNSGTVNGAGDLSFAGTLNWNGGTIGGSGALAVGGTLNANGADLVMSRAYTNNGTLAVQTGKLTLAGGGSNNGARSIAAGATLRFVADYTHQIVSPVTGTGTAIFDAGTQTFNGNANFAGTVNFNAGVITGPGTIFFLKNLNWNGGTFSGAGEVGSTVNTVFTLAGPGTKALQRNLTMNGIMNHTGGALALTNSTVTIAAGRTYTNDGVAPIQGAAGTNLFKNLGIFVKKNTTTLNITAPFNNSGTFNTLAGIVNVSAGGVNSSARNIVAGATLVYTDSYEHANFSTLDGGGSVNFSGGTQNISGNWTVGTTLKMVAGILSGAGNIDINGTVFWLDGQIEGAGTITINNNGKLAISGLPDKSLARSVTNNGTLQLLNGNLLLTDVTITNNANKFFYLLPDCLIGTGGGTNVINNAGTFKKQGPSTITLGAGIGLNNTGLVDVRNGTLNLVGPVTQVSGTTLTGGDWNLMPGATLDLPGTGITAINAAASVTIIGTATTFDDLSGLVSSAGDLTFLGSADLAVTPATGSTFTNTGTLTLGRGSLFAITGNYTQTGAGTLAIFIGGTSTALYGRLTASNQATLAGTVSFSFVSGFQPANGNTFSFLTAGSRTGTFTTANIPNLTGLKGTVQYTNVAARLVISPA